MIPTVAIVGRPNVGKSTLFNRLTGKKDAIVDQMEGVTRDRKYGDAEWNGRSYLLIDTGGFIAITDDEIISSVRRQAEFAVDDADLIVLVVDVTTGITSGDDAVAELLRKSGKKVILVANKVDSASRDSDIHEFTRLGLGQPYPVSAELGRRVGDMLDVLVGELPAAETDDNSIDAGISVAIVGVPNVGKSSFVNKILGSDRQIVTEIPGTTRDTINSEVIYNDQKFTLLDTAGLRRKSKIKGDVEFYSTVRSHRAIMGCDVAVVLVDAERGLDKQERIIINAVLDNKKGLICAVNKWDLLKKETNTAIEYSREMLDRLPLLENYPIAYISALTGQRAFKVLDTAKTIYEESNKKIKTRELNEWLLNVIGKTSPPSSHGKIIKLTFISQVKSGPPIFVVFVNDPDKIPEHYRRFLESRLRESFGFRGVPLTIYYRKK